MSELSKDSVKRGQRRKAQKRRKVLTIRKIALGACLMLCGMALAQERTYTVKQGDTLSEIAGKFKADKKAIIYANRLQNAHRLKLGQKLVIPTQSSKVKKTESRSSGLNYSVQPGDTDESIAKKLGISSHELRGANAGVNWTRLQIGQELALPSTKDWFSVMANQAVAQAQVSQTPDPQPAITLTAAKKEAPKPFAAHRTYTVQKGDNDWIIAKRLGIKPSELRGANPAANWSNLQIGLRLRVPGTKEVFPEAKAAAGPNLPRIKSRYAVLTSNDVSARRGPSVRFPVVVQVDKGTRVMVLDREGSWYKLRFPRGTEAWVRADYLAPTSSPALVAKKSVNKPTIVAKSTKAKTSKTKVVASRTTRSSQATRNRRTPTTNSGKPLAYASNGNGGLLDKANSFIGVRYRYGAASRSATDCSGFTTQVFRSQGVKLPRTAAQQSTRGQKVSKGELKPGDLVFFNTRGSRVSHVGIYKGDGKFIHASSGRGRVMESSLSEGYYQRRFAGARRVISSKKSATVAKKSESASKEETKVPVVTTPDPQVEPPPGS